MLSRYHIAITKESVGAFFAPAPFKQIVRANVRQDSILSIFGVEARRHVCDCTVMESLDYIAEEHRLIGRLAQRGGTEMQQRHALGRLLHTVQDFYAHTNYVALWMAAGAGTENAGQDGLDPAILFHPRFQIAEWQSWRDPLYYVPLLGGIMRRLWLPERSHEAINLDSPKRGQHFALAAALARQKTLIEYARVIAAIRDAGGQDAVLRFHGFIGYAPSAFPISA